MWSLVIVFTLLGFIVYFLLFWAPSEETATISTTLATTRVVPGTASAKDVALTAERCWYGITFRGYHDEYSFATQQTAQCVLKHAREFFADRNCRILIEEPHHLRVSKSSNLLLAYLKGLDTGFPQEIDVSTQAAPESTLVLVRYDVPGHHIRIPPNNLRREVLELLSVIQISGDEPSASPNGGPAELSGDSGVSGVPPSVS